MQIFTATAAGWITPEEGAQLMIENDRRERTMSKVFAFLKALNRSKIVNGIGSFFALAIPVLLVVVKGLPPTWSVTLLIASAVGVLSRAQYIFQKVVPLLDGSKVIQVSPPTAGQLPVLPVVAQSPTPGIPVVTQPKL
jgi:hypothetical protein